MPLNVQLASVGEDEELYIPPPEEDAELTLNVQIDPQGGVDITYSLTTMGCPIGPMIEDQMRQFLAGVPGVDEVRPEMVLRPPWSPEMMSDEAKAALGIF